ncbi:MAG: Ig-like domain-containing protein, partial [Pseudomonadota bacterium]
NPGPIAADDPITLAGRTSQTLMPLANDTDPDNDALEIVQINGQAIPAGGVVSLSNGASVTVGANGALTYSAGATTGTTDSFTYTIADADGAEAAATVSLTMPPPNQPPIVITPDDPDGPSPNPQTVIPVQPAVEGAAATPLNVSDYIRDPEGEPLTYSAADLPPGLTIDPTTGVITGNVPADAIRQNGGDPNFTATVTATDPHGASVDVTVRFVVTNPAPVVAADLISIRHTDPGATGDVLANDRDPDGDALAVSAVNGASTNVGVPIAGDRGGLFTVLADGTFTFDPNGAFDNLQPGEVVETRVLVTVVDADGVAVTQPLTIRILGPTTSDGPPGDPPTISQSDSGSEGLGWLETFRAGLGTLFGSGEPMRDPLAPDPGLARPYFGDLAALELDLPGTSARLLVEVVGTATPAPFEFGHEQHVLTVGVAIAPANDVAAPTDVSLKDVRFTRMDGAPLPPWVTVQSDGVLRIAPPADQETLRFRLTTTFGDGSVRDHAITMNLRSGEIFEGLRKDESFSSLEERARSALAEADVKPTQLARALRDDDQ